MDFQSLSAARYSLRKFDPRPVEQEKLDLILEAGRNAPTAHNYQPQRIFVLQSPGALEKADACAGSHFNPPVILAVAYDPAVSWKREYDGKDHGEIDATIAVTQMMLQAADLGLGTTYVGMFEPERLLAAFPEMAEQISAYAATSQVLTGVDGMYMSLFVALPLTNFLYRKLKGEKKGEEKAIDYQKIMNDAEQAEDE